tara:strand:+ start:1366 stop:2163 length:798 start_codon:yes stop_codon:yes gene_type:complete
MPNSVKVAVIFDLDETIGHFYQVGKMWEGLKFFEDNKFKESDFHKMLDLYPFIFRPGIFDIFNYLKKEKKKSNKLRVIIYSNNMGTPKWANMIKNYIEKKINYKLFDKVITAWKVNGVIYEKCRRTNEKTYEEIIRCAKLNKKTELFFVDDAYHPRMFNSKTDYMHIKEYKFAYNIDNMVEKYLNSNCCKKLSKKSLLNLRAKLPNYVRRLDWGYVRYENGNKPSQKEKKLGKDLLKNIKSFLKEKNKSSLKRKKKSRKKYTRKK